jgi:two-component system KDP operon response regulator KdpE
MSEQSVSVLVVDDEPSLRKVIRASLAASGFTVEEVGTGKDAVGAVQQRPFDLILLDINMPGIGGIETCRRIRALAPHTGIVMVTVRDAEEDKVRALEAGADDYVTKPFRFRELVARMGAVFRRTHLQNAPEPATVSIGELKMDFDRRLLWKGGDEIHLSPTEFDLLALLMKNQGAPLTHAKLLRTVWGPEYGGELEYLRIARRPLLPRKLPTGTAPNVAPRWLSSKNSPRWNSRGAVTSIPPDAATTSGASTCSTHANAFVCPGSVESLSSRSKARCGSRSSHQIGRFYLPHSNFHRWSAAQPGFSRHQSAIQFP